MQYRISSASLIKPDIVRFELYSSNLEDNNAVIHELSIAISISGMSAEEIKIKLEDELYRVINSSRTDVFSIVHKFFRDDLTLTPTKHIGDRPAEYNNKVGELAYGERTVQENM